MGVKAGIVINPDCPVEAIYPLLPQVDYVLIMSVFAGFGGQKFIPQAVNKVRRLRKMIEITLWVFKYCVLWRRIGRLSFK